jgi:hypothetical protein
MSIAQASMALLATLIFAAPAVTKAQEIDPRTGAPVGTMRNVGPDQSRGPNPNRADVQRRNSEDSRARTRSDDDEFVDSPLVEVCRAHPSWPNCR